MPIAKLTAWLGLDGKNYAAGMKGEWGKIYWKKNKDSWKVDHRSILHEIESYVPADVLHDAQEKFTTIKPGARVFRPYFAKGD
jgi:hypothetical protein